MSFALLSGIKLHLEAAEPAGEDAFRAICLATHIFGHKFMVSGESCI